MAANNPHNMWYKTTMLTDSVGQEFTQGTTGMTFHYAQSLNCGDWNHLKTFHSSLVVDTGWRLQAGDLNLISCRPLHVVS